MTERMSVRAWARRRGVSYTAAGKALRRNGILPGEDGRIDVAAADRMCDELGILRPRPGSTAAAEVASSSAEASAREQPDNAIGRVISFAVARARKELALAQLRELELAQKRAELIPADLAQRTLERCLLLVAKALDNLEGSLPPRCEGRSQGEIRMQISTEIEAIKAELIEAATQLDEDDDEPGIVLDSISPE